jgi:hypothetical protein
MAERDFGSSRPGHDVPGSVLRSGPGRSRTERGRRGPGEAAWLAWLAFAFGVVAAIVHRDRDSRFLFTVTPPLWLCAASNAIALANAALRRLPWRAIRETAWIAAGLALIAAAWLARPSTEALAGRRAAFRGPARLAPVIAAALDAVGDATRENHRARVVLLGESNVLSPGLLAWRARLAHPEWPASRLPKRAPYLEPGADEAALEERLDWLEAHADFVVVALADSVGAPQRAEYARETRTDRETVARMREDAARWRPLPARRVSEGSVESFRVGARAPDSPPRANHAAAARVTPPRGVP